MGWLADFDAWCDRQEAARRAAPRVSLAEGIAASVALFRALSDPECWRPSYPPKVIGPSAIPQLAARDSLNVSDTHSNGAPLTQHPCATHPCVIRPGWRTSPIDLESPTSLIALPLAALLLDLFETQRVRAPISDRANAFGVRTRRGPRRPWTKAVSGAWADKVGLPSLGACGAIVKAESRGPAVKEWTLPAWEVSWTAFTAVYGITVLRSV
jgi:hypothetical protein